MRSFALLSHTGRVAATGFAAVAALSLCGVAATAAPRGTTFQRPVTLSHPVMYRIRPRTAPTPTPIFAGGGSVPATMLRNWGDTYGVPIQQPALPSRPNVELLYASSSGGSGQRYFLNQAFDLVSAIAAKPLYTDTNERTQLHVSVSYVVGTGRRTRLFHRLATLDCRPPGLPFSG